MTSATFRNDRQIIECLLIPTMMGVVINGIRKGLSEADIAPEHHAEIERIFASISALLEHAILEPLRGLAPERIPKLLRRTKRVASTAWGTRSGTMVIMVQYLAIAHLTQWLADQGLITIGAKSDFSAAWDEMAWIITSGEDNIDRFEAEAADVAADLREHLAIEGYFGLRLAA